MFQIGKRLSWALVFAVAGGHELCRGDVAQWNLNDSLDSSTGGLALIPEAAPPAAAPAVSFTDAMINGFTARVASFTRGTYFRLRHGLRPNGGGARVNQYTVIMDVFFPDRTPSGGWAVLWQTSAANADDGDWAVNPGGGLGNGRRYGGAVTDGSWYRIALVVDAVANVYRSFIDGSEVQKVIGGQVTLDGRFSLGEEALLFADDNQENAEGLLNSIQVLDFALSASELLALGGPGADGIPFPSSTCPRSFTCVLDRASRKVTLSWKPGANLGGGGYEVLRNGASIARLAEGVSTFTDELPPAAGRYLYELLLISGDPAACPHLPLRCRADLLPANQFFADDFEDYRDDLELISSGWQPVDVNAPVEDATWTVTNPGGRLPPPTANGTPSVGVFLISDSDKACCDNPTGSGMSHDIWSPSFSCETAQKVWLHFNCSAQLNNNGRVVFDVDVSTDGGENWLNVFRRVAPQRSVDPAVTIDNADGVFGRLDIDLTDVAARQPVVMFRLRQFEPNDDWWIAVDDVLVDDVPPPRGEVVVLPRQTFSQGIPPDWTVTSLIDSGKPWSTVDACARSLLNTKGGVFPDPFDGRGLHRLDEAFAIVDSDCARVPQEELLLTPAIDCTQCNQVFLHFKSDTVADTGSVQEVRLSLDGGRTFETTPIFTFGAGALYDSGEDPFYNEYNFEVPEAARKNGVAFGFYYQSPGGTDRYWWAIDDVEVSATGNLNPRGCDNRGFQVAFNPQSGAVTGSWKGITGDQGFRVLQAGRQIGADLPAATLTFTDPTPPVGGTGVTYTLQVLVGGAVESQCVSQEITTFACQAGLACAVNHESKEVTLTWNKAINANTTGYELRRDGEKLATLGLNETSYLERTGPGIFEYELSLVPGPGAHPSQCPTPIACRAIVVGDFIFFDDFEGYAGDRDLVAAGWERKEVNTPVEDAAWTITNPGGRFNPPVFDGRPSSGKFIVSDSDNASGENPTGSGMSHDLWSPPIDVAGKNVVWLHMDVSAQLNNNGTCVFDVDISTDDGKSWENVFRRVAPQRIQAEPLATTRNADGFFGRLDLDLTALVAQKPSFRFRLRHFEPNDDWWIAVDNVLVDEVPVTGGKTIVLPRETFTDGIPRSWTVESRIGGTANWSTEDLCSRSLVKSGLEFPDGFDGRGLHRLDEWFAIVDSNCAAADQDEILATPVLDCSALKQVYLHVKSDIVADDSKVQEILLSLDGGKTFEKSPVLSYNGGGLFDSGEDPFYNEYILAVPRAAGKDQVVFAFHYRSAPSGQSRFWAVDDVMVTGDSAVVLPVFHRGDTNSDGSLDLSDAVFILSFLFLGGPSPTCAETGDGNDDGLVDISDGVFLLTYQFLGGPAPAPPGPPGNPCGPDRDGSPKDLGCESYPGC